MPEIVTIFPKPFPVPGSSWGNLTAQVRQLWQQWAWGNPVSDTDFKNVIRTGQTSFAIVNTNTNTQLGFVGLLTLPPAPADFERGIIQPITLIVTTDNSFTFAVKRTPKAERQFQCWATMPQPHEDTCSLATLNFLASFTVPADAQPADRTTDLGTAYSEAFTPLDDYQDSNVGVFLFEHSNGQLEFAGSVYKSVIAL